MVYDLEVRRRCVLVIGEEDAVEVGLPIATTPWGSDLSLGGWLRRGELRFVHLLLALAAGAHYPSK
jgi:hypothetical protein